jgi:hypothetical protein
MLRIALMGPDEIFDNIIEEAIPLWGMELSIGSYMLILHVIYLLQVTFFV